MTADPAAELAAALRRLLDSLNGRSVDRRAAADHARDTLQRWELTR
ncbi:MAG: hypothetical protein WKF86_00045 [Acidimicrobiales bacterium]